MAGTKFNTFEDTVTAPSELSYLGCCESYILHKLLVLVIIQICHWIGIEVLEVRA